MKLLSRRRFVYLILLFIVLPLAIAAVWIFSVFIGLEKSTNEVGRIIDPASLRQVKQGRLEGFSTPGSTHMWLGIPFSEPVSGERRWRMPTPHRGWDGTRSFVDDPELCFQFGQPFEKLPEQGHFGVEDCLTLDIIAPAFQPDAIPTGDDSLPVMVWVHGGGNTIGGPQELTKNRLVPEENIILVSIRYRLGPFGWFSHSALRETGVPSSNFGTEDMITALQWVQENIGAFGGDPDNVTLAGQSSGGINIFSLMLSPRAKDLFHRAIIQSGGAATTSRVDAENSLGDPEPGVFNNSADITTSLLVSQGVASDDLAAQALVKDMSSQALISFLKSVPPLDLARAYQRHPDDKMFSFPNIIRDGFTIPFEEPEVIVSNREAFNAVPVIFGTNRDELKLFLLFDEKTTKRNFLGIPSVTDLPRFERISQYLAKVWKFVGADRPASWMLEAGYPQVYVYRFDWDEEPSYLGMDFGALVGASHNMEIPFMTGQFENTGIFKYFFTKNNAAGRKELSEAMRQYWAEFARHGKPANGRTGNLAHWTPWSVEPRVPTTMALDTSAGGGTRMVIDRVQKDRLSEALLLDDSLDMPTKCGLFKTFVYFKVWTQEGFDLFTDGACN